MSLLIILLIITLACYAGAAVLYLLGMLGESAPSSRRPACIALTGLCFHTLVLVARGVAVHRVPFYNLFESLMFTAWVLVAIYLLVERRFRATALGTFICLAAIAMLVLAVVLPKGVSETLLPSLNSRWSVVHITSSLISYACFALAFGAALGYLVQERLLKQKIIGRLQQHLPPLRLVDHLAYEMVMLGFLTLTLGIVTGSIWAQEAWGSFWNWDPKETCSLVTWLVYAVYLHMRGIQGWHGKWANRLLISGFLCVLTTYIGINFFGGGLHVYKW